MNNQEKENQSLHAIFRKLAQDSEDEELRFLIDLPETKTVQFGQTSLLMCHGSPWSNDFYIYPDCEKEIINKCDIIGFDFVLISNLPEKKKHLLLLFLLS